MWVNSELKNFQVSLIIFREKSMMSLLVVIFMRGPIMKDYNVWVIFVNIIENNALPFIELRFVFCKTS